ncbi:hypothetical protein DW355_12685 [Hylemonella gracilis]|jgi:hypothetical protein|uniref:DUF2946 domain-containing protein n=1 Tax=Hylemonella gracilis TaxID=80880 RepID=A0A4P6UJF2_9BURK|nr:hypothetical protein [Hylemonella gracilis]QBK05478.1 hypothetical protein DW355_12685 [Hylemonella gracilis]
MVSLSVSRRPFSRLRLGLVLLAWFAQLCLPMGHAALMAAPQAQASWWCGDQDGALEMWAALPPELRAGLDAPAGTDGKHHPPGCAQFCAQGARAAAPPMQVAIAVPSSRAAGRITSSAPRRPAPPDRYVLAPPAQGPPTLRS